MRRFVVQEHSLRPGDVHFDLMVEEGPVLVTFQLEAPPGGGAPARGRRSFDHRALYLDYEGPIAGDRGAVRIWARGHVTDLEGGPRDARWRARVDGRRADGGALAGVLLVHTHAAPATGADSAAETAAAVEVELELELDLELELELEHEHEHEHGRGRAGPPA